MSRTHSKRRNPGPNAWLTPFMELRKRLRCFVEANVTLGHAVFLTGLREGADISPHLEELEPWYKYRKAPVEVVQVSFPEGVWAYHCFYSHDRKDFCAFTNELRDLMRWLEYVPENVLPKFRKPKTKSRESHNIIRWMSLLYYLAWKHQDVLLDADLLCSDSDVDVECYPWSSSSAFPDCDPVSLITLAPQGDKGLASWQPGEGSGDCRHPEFFEAYLHSDVLQASIAAVTLLKYYGIDPCEHESEAGAGVDVKQLLAKMSRKKRWEARRNRPSDIPMGLLGVLVSHHHKPDGTIKKEALGSEEIEKMMNLPQEQISRLMKQIFPRTRLSTKTGKPRSRAMEQYRDLVAEGKLEDYQSKLESEDHWNARTMGNRSADSFISRQKGSRKGRTRWDC